MPRPRLQASPLTAAERQATSRQAASAQRPATRGAGPAPAAAAQPLGSSGSDADRTTGRIPRLARQLTGQP